MLLVSACLLGHNTKYNGKSNADRLLLKYQSSGRFIPICPEVCGGLSTPRPPAEITGGSGCDVLAGIAKVFDKNQKDVTAEFIDGAKRIAALLKQHTITCAILKERSPSCGTAYIYDGSFSGTLINGRGITAALLKQYGISLFSEETITEKLLTALIKADLTVK